MSECRSCYRAATTLRRTRTNQADCRPLEFLVRQRARFAWVFLLILRIDEALRRLSQALEGAEAQQRVRFAVVFPVTGRIVEALRRPTATASSAS